MCIVKEEIYNYITRGKMFRNHNLEIVGKTIKLYKTSNRIITINLSMGYVICENAMGSPMPISYDEIKAINHIFYLEYKECPKHQFKKKK